MTEIHIRTYISISENYFGFNPKKFTMEAIHLIKQIIEYNKKKSSWFSLTQKDNVPREVLWWTMTKKGIPRNTLIQYKICIKK